MVTVDAVVIGGGIVGMCTALRLAEAGLDVHILDRRQPGRESSLAGAGLLLPQTETDPPGAEGGLPGMVRAEEMFPACLAARDAYPRFLDWLMTQPGAAEGIPAGGIPPALRLEGVLCCAMEETDLPRLRARVDWQTGQGLEAGLLTSSQAAERLAGLECRGAAYFPRDGWIDNQALMPVLEAAVREATTLHVDTEATGIEAREGRVAGVTTSRPGMDRIAANHVVLAAGAWSDRLLPATEPALGVAPCRGQMIHMYAGADAPAYPAIGGEYYVVPRPGGRVLLGATLQDAGFDTSVPEESVQEILAGVAEFLPGSRDWKRLEAWSGLRPQSADEIPVIGAGLHAGLWFATGHFRNGLLLGPLTGEWIAEGVKTGTMPPEAAPFAPRAATGV